MYYRNPFRKTKCGKFAFLLILLIFVAMTVSCAGGDKRVNKKPILKGKYTIEVVKKSRNYPFLSKIKLEHPYNFTTKKIFLKLMSLRYEIFTIGGKNKKIFGKKLARHLSPYFVNAFKKANKNEFIRFGLQSSQGSIIGDMFISRSKLNLRFNTINGIPFESDDTGSPSENWTLMLHKGEKYHKISKLFIKENLENWIILPLKAASAKAPASKVYEPDEKIDEIETKFTRLKFLLDKGIISREEYNIKKKELMEQFF